MPIQTLKHRSENDVRPRVTGAIWNSPYMHAVRPCNRDRQDMQMSIPGNKAQAAYMLIERIKNPSGSTEDPSFAVAAGTLPEMTSDLAMVLPRH